MLNKIRLHNYKHLYRILLSWVCVCVYSKMMILFPNYQTSKLVLTFQNNFKPPKNNSKLVIRRKFWSTYTQHFDFILIQEEEEEKEVEESEEAEEEEDDEEESEEEEEDDEEGEGEEEEEQDQEKERIRRGGRGRRIFLFE